MQHAKNTIFIFLLITCSFLTYQMVTLKKANIKQAKTIYRMKCDSINNSTKYLEKRIELTNLIVRIEREEQRLKLITDNHLMFWNEIQSPGYLTNESKQTNLGGGN